MGRDNYAAMHANFRWHVPPHFNMAEACCGRWARRPDADSRIAIRAHGVAEWNTLTFAELQLMAHALSNLLVSLGVGLQALASKRLTGSGLFNTVVVFPARDEFRTGERRQQPPVARDEDHEQPGQGTGPAAVRIGRCVRCRRPESPDYLALALRLVRWLDS